MKLTVLAGFLFTVLVAAAPARAQAPNTPAPPSAKTGPIIRGFGAVYDVPSADFKVSPDQPFKVVFSVSETGESPSAVNRGIDNAARFLNMHAAAGVPRERMKLVVVIHGPAGKDALTNDGYRQRFGVDNPNLPLVAQLREAGVEFYMCGQTAAKRNLQRAQLTPEVKMALSAATVIATLVPQGYTLIP